jgi:DNA-binding beta-propeller fold protein YncE
MKNLKSSSLVFCGACCCAGLLYWRERPVVAASAQNAVLLVANQKDQNLSVVDPATNRQNAVIPEDGYTGHELAVSPDGKTAYVPIYGDSGVGKPGRDGRTMDVIDIASRKVIRTVDFGHGVRPHRAIYEPHSGLLYVTTELDHTITAIDPHTLKIVGSIPTGQAESHMLAITRDGRFGYTANVGPGSVSVLDLKARKTVTVIPVAPTVQRISLSNDDKLVFVADYTKPQMAVIDTATNKVKSWITLPSIGYGTASTTDGKWLLVAMTSASKVAVVDLSTLQVARTIDVPAGPTEILVRPDGEAAYVSCGASGKVAVLDLSAWKMRAVIDAGKGADGLAWARL